MSEVGNGRVEGYVPPYNHVAPILVYWWQQIVVFRIARVYSNDYTVLSMADFGIEASTPTRVTTSFSCICDTNLLCRMELSLCYCLGAVLRDWVSGPVHTPPAEVDVVAATLCLGLDLRLDLGPDLGLRLRVKVLHDKWRLGEGIDPHKQGNSQTLEFEF